MPEPATVPESGDAQGIVCTLKPSIDLQQDFFAVFGLKPSCDIDLADLALRYRRLQQAVHPDKFLRECDRSQRLAQQQAALVNEAYRTLRSPLDRAHYLLVLAGQAPAQETTTQDVAFLMQQMDLRQRLDEAADSLPELDQLHSDVNASIAELLADFSTAWQQRDWVLAHNLVVKLQFASKLAQEIEERQARLLDA